MDAGRSDSTYKAPLLLIPVRLERRKRALRGFQLLLHEDEIQFNPTLIHMLRQDFHMSIPEIEAGLPVDGSGVDVAGILRAVEDRVKDIRGWEVSDELVLSTLSFTKYLMWKDLTDRTEALKREPCRPPPDRHALSTPTRRANRSFAARDRPDHRTGADLHAAFGGIRRRRPRWSRPLAARTSSCSARRDRQEPDDRQHDLDLPRAR